MREVRVLTFRRKNGEVIEVFKFWDKNYTDSMMLHRALCEIDPGSNYTVEFADLLED